MNCVNPSIFLGIVLTLAVNSPTLAKAVMGASHFCNEYKYPEKYSRQTRSINTHIEKGENGRE
jgi:hypothetical protein